MTKTRHLLALAALSLALAGCRDATQPQGLAPGMRFQYSGLRAGQFSAVGAHGGPAAAYAVDYQSRGELWSVADTRVSP